jgi:hypothetical protein
MTEIKPEHQSYVAGVARKKEWLESEAQKKRLEKFRSAV